MRIVKLADNLFIIDPRVLQPNYMGSWAGNLLGPVSQRVSDLAWT